MTARTRHTAALNLVAIAAGLLLLCAPAMAADTVSPLPASDYTVRAACKPPSMGTATCLALQLVPRTIEARARTHPLVATRSHAIAAESPKEGDYGLTPGQLHSAYGLPTTTGTTQTIALVDAYNDPNAASDLKGYEKEFGLKSCKESACFTKVNEEGNGAEASLPFPQNEHELETAFESANKERVEEAEEAAGWDVEISLDIEAARATCENCHILLVEASSTEDSDLSAAEDWAAEHGDAQEISNSWGGREGASATPFNHPGIVITASAGDDGYLGWDARHPSERGYASFPASSPDVVAVGGTRLLYNEAGEWESETVWNDGGERAGSVEGYGATGGGCSELFTAQPWQQHVSDWEEVGCGTKRAVADVAADGDPFTGFALYDTNLAPEESSNHWYTYGGTSLSSPIIASTYALAGGSGGVEYPAQTLYQNEDLFPASLHDVGSSTTTGSNGKCSKPFEEEEPFLTGCTPEKEAKASCAGRLACLAHGGYDGPSGVGTPNGLHAFEPLTTEEIESLTKTEEAEAKAREEERAHAHGEEEREEQEAEDPGPLPSPVISGGSTSTVTHPAPTVTTTTTAPLIELSGLALTPHALVALNRSRPKISHLSFEFTLNIVALVHASLEERVGKRGHRHWKLLQRPMTIAAVGGRNSKHLGGRQLLGKGAYRLKLAPAGGTARSISFNIG
jgi:Subtilase family